MSSINPQVVMLVIAALVALALLTQAVVMLALLLGIRKAYNAARGELEQLRSSVLPFVTDAREFFTRVAPKIEQTSVDVAALTHSLRQQANELQSTTADFLERAHRQANRLDSMATSILDGVDRAGAFVTSVLNKPMRQLSGILASVKAVVESLRTTETTQRASTNHVPGDPEMFV